MLAIASAKMTPPSLASQLLQGAGSGGAATQVFGNPVGNVLTRVNLRPLSPVYPAASRNGSGDLALSWTRRSRLSSSWWATGTAAPVGEASEAYEVDILNGSTVVRTIASGTPSITYTAAQQTTDFGSAQASITLRIAQLSAVVGRGVPLEVTV